MVCTSHMISSWPTYDIQPPGNQEFQGCKNVSLLFTIDMATNTKYFHLKDDI